MPKIVSFLHVSKYSCRLKFSEMAAEVEMATNQAPTEAKSRRMVALLKGRPI